MRRLIVHMSVSLDGFVAHADGSIDWHAPEGAADHGAVRHHANLEMLRQARTIVMGRHACEQMASSPSAAGRSAGA